MRTSAEADCQPLQRDDSSRSRALWLLVLVLVGNKREKNLASKKQSIVMKANYISQASSLRGGGNVALYSTRQSLQ